MKNIIYSFTTGENPEKCDSTRKEGKIRGNKNL